MSGEVVLDGSDLKNTLNEIEEEAKEKKFRLAETFKVTKNGDLKPNPLSLSSLDLQQLFA